MYVLTTDCSTFLTRRNFPAIFFIIFSRHFFFSAVGYRGEKKKNIGKKCLVEFFPFFVGCERVIVGAVKSS
jgi:hypothetical protein